MTRDDIIRIAREAGAMFDHMTWVERDLEPVFKRFFHAAYAAGAAAEREKVARWQIGSGYTTGHGETIEDLLVELEWQVRESEREACAKVCEDEIQRVKPIYSVVAENSLKAIRARGEK